MGVVTEGFAAVDVGKTAAWLDDDDPGRLEYASGTHQPLPRAAHGAKVVSVRVRTQPCPGTDASKVEGSVEIALGVEKTRKWNAALHQVACLVRSRRRHGDNVDPDGVQFVTAVAQLREIASAGDSTVVAKALDKETTAEEVLELDAGAIGSAKGDGREGVAHFEHAVAPLVTR
jgi:hypothetical protein